MTNLQKSGDWQNMLRDITYMYAAVGGLRAHNLVEGYYINITCIYDCSQDQGKSPVINMKDINYVGLLLTTKYALQAVCVAGCQVYLV